MLFNSIEYAIFLPVVFLLYWFVFNKKLWIQNGLILIVSYVFYGWWDWRFLSLIVFSSIVDFVVGNLLGRYGDLKIRRVLLIVSIMTNLGLLAVFKYYNFFAESFIELLNLFSVKVDDFTLSIMLPVGISFYTFQTMSYTIDVYKGKLEPTSDIVAFFSFVSFFPQLVAGPIERAKDLLPQFHGARKFDQGSAEDGLKQIVWGLFKKIVIADNCAVYVNQIFGNYHDYSSGYLLMGAVYFAFQIYGDFSGYSDIAIGSARLLGFRLTRNFAFPYFSRDIAEFWRRWHISLSSWFRDYVYIPLGGNRVSLQRNAFNILIVFVVSGFWHGANWTFLFWGFLHGVYFLPLMIFKVHKKNSQIVAENKIFPSVSEFLQIFLTFFLVLIGWIFFRAENIGDGCKYLIRAFDLSSFEIPATMKSSLPLILIMLIVEWFGRKSEFGLAVNQLNIFVRRLIYLVIIGFIAYFSTDQDIAFIYFQF